MDHNSRMARSMFITSDCSNHGDLFSSSPSLSIYQNSHVSSSYFGVNNSHMTYHMMRRNIDFVSSADYLPMADNSRLTRVSFTQTITNKYTSIVPTNTLDTFQYGIERVKQGMDSRTNIWNPAFRSPNFLDKHCKILNPKPLSVIFPCQDYAYRQQADMFSSPSRHNYDQNNLQGGRPLKKIFKPTMVFEETTDDRSFEENKKSDDDGRTHSLPYEKYGPYTCPKCNGIFDTSQKFAAHMSSHYKTETDKERAQRFRARNKRKYGKLNLEVHGESQKINPEDGVNSGGRSDDKIVKEELL
ncbi:PREDICTED: uncharacterized protein LOC104747690 [Camelina sativa]|uniref:Uncharacterized protein LOC104747690 n=1 Tax=Camelina sativa TaxID=90675 RepID=A0ABM0W9K7_CAMSA|nr:PREDICTED: uncharacterized protein LOC104747690 [Camelina sativa]